MPVCVDSKFSLELVQNYFAQLNPIATRIVNDIDETKSNYGQLWCTLNPNEQTDIINETLIRPELSLRYFDNFSTNSADSAESTPSSCGNRAPSSKSASADSLAAVVLKNINDTLGRTKKNEPEKAKAAGKHAKCNTTENLKHFYAYDGRNLRTFALQKVGLKIVQDDVVGAYRDEHSLPFCYRTKSQINLHLFADTNSSDYSNRAPQRDDEICLLNASFHAVKTADPKDVPKHDRTSIENYKKLQNELKLNLRRDSKDKLNPVCEKKEPQHNPAPYERLDNQKVNSTVTKAHKAQPTRPLVKPPPAPVPAAAAVAAAVTANNANANDKKSIIVDCKSLETAMNARNMNEPRLKSYLNANAAASTTSMTYAVYSDAFYDHGERTNLMQNFGSSGGGGSGFLTASSSSAATSDDDDEKTLCEEVKLLDNDASLRKGFDFLNNW